MSNRILTRFNPSKPERRSSDFISFARADTGNFMLASIKNGKPAEFGLIAFTRQMLSANDVIPKTDPADDAFKTSLDVEFSGLNVSDFAKKVGENAAKAFRGDYA